MKIFFSLILALAFWAAPAFADDTSTRGVDAAAQEKVAQLIQSVLGTYRNEDDLRNGATNNTLRNLTNIETNFRQASALMPSRLDLRFGIASALVLQSVQTNSPFDLKIKSALAVYQEIRDLDSNGFEAGVLLAAYARAIGETNTSEAAVRQLAAVHPQRTRESLERLRRADAILEAKLNTEPRLTMPTNRSHAIVVLGAALETNGTMKPKLLARLQQGLKLGRIYPEAPIILTGGNPKSGVTEAYAMSLWLQKEGILPNRIYLEDRANDTVGNAIFSSAILQRLGITHVTLVTSEFHLRRGLADLEEACLQRGLQLNYGTLAAVGEPEFDLRRERVSVYRDVLRVGGLWAFPGIQR